ncbi:MAG: ABC transporter substrate-binding protein, partial [Psychroserpens sp.]|nr:ABC transporter substrate-binding protein [Psychroserpens sp.]
MKPIQLLTLVLFFVFQAPVSGQDFSSLWEGHFSYLNIVDISSTSEEFYAASEGAIFTYDFATNDIEKISTVEGLSGGDISTIYYSEENDILVVGYENGLMDVVLSDGEVLAVIDILNKVTIPPNTKKINHFYEYEGLLYISADFGISVYDLERLEFGDTYFIGNGGSQIIVNQTTVYDGFIYAACSNNNGLKRADLSNPNLIDFNQWESIRTGNFLFIENVEDKIFAIALNRAIVDVLENPFAPLFQYPIIPNDMRNIGSDLIITTDTTVYIYDGLFNQIGTIINNPDFGVDFSVTTTDGFGSYYIGTIGIINQGKPGKGVLRTSLSAPDMFDEIYPDGPLNNNVFDIEATPNNLWAVFGGFSRTFNFNGGIQRSGISQLRDEEWNNIPFDTIAQTIVDPFFLSDISINPFDNNQLFVSSYWSGMIEFNDGVATTLYNQDNSTLTPFSGNLKLVTTSSFDRNGVLWVMNARNPSPLNKFENGQW